MKDENNKPATAVKKDEEKKEEPYDPFFGKCLFAGFHLLSYRVQEGHGSP